MRRANRKDPRVVLENKIAVFREETSTKHDFRASKKYPIQEILEDLSRRQLKKVVKHLGPNWSVTAKACLKLHEEFSHIPLSNLTIAVTEISKKLIRRDLTKKLEKRKKQYRAQ